MTINELTTTVTRWSARCECYKDHNSASGRCNVRDVFGENDKAALCERCREECAGVGHDANARLIAAAPEMLEVLRAIVDSQDLPSSKGTPEQRLFEAVKQARAILAQVEGR
jgi:hypothetical protein